jgi:hypothetical protein
VGAGDGVHPVEHADLTPPIDAFAAVAHPVR